MRKSASWLGVWLASLATLSAQVTVRVTLDQDQFLPGESLPAEVRITNRSGQTLHLGSDPGWLVFSIESKDGFIVVKTGNVPVVGAFTLGSSKMAIKHVDLAPYFNLGRTGRYSIIATVSIKDWNEQITSPPKAFDIVQGAELWHQDVGVPMLPGVTNEVPEVRRYTLEQANYLRQLMLYLQITDAMGKVYKVFPLGPMLSFGQPEPQVDKYSNLHVLYQNGPHSFSYTVVNTDGTVILRQTYDYTTRPRLMPDANDNLMVVGGRRHLMPDDIPSPKVAEGTTQTNEP